MIVGVDPGLKTGVAVYSEAREEITFLKTLDWWDAIDYLTLVLKDASLILVEDPSQNKPVFNRALGAGPMGRISQNVGSNKTMASLMIEALIRHEIPVKAVRPSKEKWNNDTFQEHFSYDGRSSQHARDAARLIYHHITSMKTS